MGRKLLFSLIAVAVTAGSANAQVWAEIPDAPALPPPQMTVGIGPLVDITGALDGAGDVDMYCIEIFAPTSFAAWTNPAFPPGTLGPAGAAFDSQLWLFKLEPGAPGPVAIMHSDDTAAVAPGGASAFSAMGFAQPNPMGAVPPHPAFTPGRYMIAISQFDIDALDPGGVEIFLDTPFAEWSGPDGPGVPFLGGWTGGGAPGGVGGGAYHIVLTGAFFCEVPAPSTAGLLGLAGLVALRRRR